MTEHTSTVSQLTRPGEGQHRIVRVVGILAVMSLLPPPDFRTQDGTLMHYHDPRASDRLHEVRDAFAKLLENARTQDPEAERLRAILRRCQRGMDPVDLGNGEVLGLYLQAEQMDDHPGAQL